MTPGSIVCYRNFTFHDGAQADKLLVVLNAGGSKPYLVLRTTSQAKHRLAKEGCHAVDGYYFLPAKRDTFPKDTWVLLYDPYEINAAQFLQAKFRGEAEIRSELKAETLRAIINCFAKSDDCSEHHLRLLGRK